MKTSDLKLVIERAAVRKAKSPAMVAVIIAFQKELSGFEPSMICNVLGLPVSYVPQVRAAMQVNEELKHLGFQVTTNKLVKENGNVDD